MMRRIAIVPLVGLLVGLMGGAAGADEPPVVIPFTDEAIVPNPCTGELTTISLTGTLRLHQFYNESGDVHHVNGTLRLEFESSDGFSGRIVESGAHNGEGFWMGGFHLTRPEESRAMQVDVQNAIARNPETGQAFRVHFRFVGVIAQEKDVVESTTFVLECLGAA